jgi:hypothetical protein
MFEAVLIICLSMQGPCFVTASTSQYPTRWAYMEAVTHMELATRLTLDTQGHDVREVVVRRTCERTRWPS